MMRIPLTYDFCELNIRRFLFLDFNASSIVFSLKFMENQSFFVPIWVGKVSFFDWMIYTSGEGII